MQYRFILSRPDTLYTWAVDYYDKRGVWVDTKSGLTKKEAKTMAANDRAYYKCLLFAGRPRPR